MALDPRILMQPRPDPLQSFMQGMQTMQGYRQNQMQLEQHQMQMEKLRQAEEEQRAIDQAIASNMGQGGAINREGVLSSLARSNKGRAAQGLQSSWLKMDAEQAKVDRENAKADLENRMRQADLQARTMGGALAAHQRGDLQTAQAMWSQSGMPGEFNPNMAFGLFRQGIDAKDVFTNEWDRQKFGEEMTFKKGEAESKRSMEEKKFAADEAYRKQQAAQGWAGINLQREKLADEKATRPVTGRRGGNPQEVDNLLRQAETILPESTGSILGAGKELVSRGIGVSTKAGQANQKLKAIEAAIMMNMPRMEGPQSDKDVALYRQMAGQIADTTLPIETRKASIATIREIAQRQAGYSAPMGDIGQKVESRNDYVKPGTTYTDPDDGTVYVAIGGPRKDPKTWKKR